MPILEFKCGKCQTKFEFIKIKSDDTAKCPECGMTGPLLEKQLSTGTSFQLKGANWAEKGKKGY